MNLGARHFCRIASDPSHPLFDRICFNQGKMPLRHKATIYPPNRANGQNVPIFLRNILIADHFLAHMLSMSSAFP